MLIIEDLHVSVAENKILKGVSLNIGEGETHVLFGLNGSGKTSLLQTVMGNPKYRVDHGRILFKDEDITALPTDERARRGIGLLFQRPPVVRGVKLGNLLGICLAKHPRHDERKVSDLAAQLNLQDLLDREINFGFSGGEIKRSELLQLLVQDPDFIMLDEPDSGVDLENMNLVAAVIKRLLEKERRAVHRRRSGLIITHGGYILDCLHADRAYVMMDGRIHCSGNPRELFDDIRTRGYGECVRCLR
ncbi:MAG: ABC transporter ATP-binding protein [Pseudomonadota bacterium]